MTGSTESAVIGSYLPWRHANMDDAFLILTLWFSLMAPPPPQSRS